MRESLLVVMIGSFWNPRGPGHGTFYFESTFRPFAARSPHISCGSLVPGGCFRGRELSAGATAAEIDPMIALRYE